MFKKCNGCRHRLKCQLSYEQQETIKDIWSSISDDKLIKHVEKKGVITITAYKAYKEGFSYNTTGLVHYQFVRRTRKWWLYGQQIDCIVLKAQLNLIVSKH